jgi:hypothetical protein
MSVILYEPKMDMVNTNKLNLDMVDLLNINHFQWDENTYPLNITIEYPHFKKYISDIYNIAKEFTIEKVGNYPVNLKYAQREGAVTSVNAFKDHSKLHVKGHIEPHEIIAATVDTEQVKQLSNIKIAENVNISIDNNKKMLFKFEMDLAIVTHILVSIVTHKNDSK